MSQGLDRDLPLLFYVISSALVGVDKETLATCTPGFPREVRRDNTLFQFNVIGHDRGYLFSHY